jgi:hypothetical protein
MTKTMIRTLGWTVSSLACAGLLAGCGSDASQGRAQVRLDMSVAAPQALAQAQPGKRAILATLTDGTNTVEINRARLLAKQVMLNGPAHPASEATADGVSDAPETAALTAPGGDGEGGAGGAGGSGGAGGTGDDLDDGYSFRTGATVIELDLTGAPSNVGVANIVEGTYDHLAIHFHKINPKAPAMAAAIAAAPEVFADFVTGGNYNIVIDGTWNGAPFQLKASNSMNGFYPVAPALVVTAPETVVTALTVQFDMTQWFQGQRGNNGGTLLDPNDNKNVKESARSIAASVRATH